MNYLFRRLPKITLSSYYSLVVGITLVVFSMIVPTTVRAAEPIKDGFRCCIGHSCIFRRFSPETHVYVAYGVDEQVTFLKSCDLLISSFGESGPANNGKGDCFYTDPSNSRADSQGLVFSSQRGNCYGGEIVCPATEGGYVPPLPDGTCPEPHEDDGCTVNGAGNPCNVATGNKYQSETDFSDNGLSFTRAYNSRTLLQIGLAKGWRSNVHKRLSIESSSLVQVGATGRGERWRNESGTWIGDQDSDVIIEQNNNSFTLTRPDGATESYNINGLLQLETDTNGNKTTYTYGVDGRLERVTNHYGHFIGFEYFGNYISRVTDSLGAVYEYEYDYSRQRLSSVVFPDTTPNDQTDNPRKIYHYEDSRFPNHLTGITDENGDRYATFAYDAQGKAISTEHSQTSNAVGQQRFELDFQGVN